MANKRLLACGKEILAIGQEGSFADAQNKIEKCFSCDNNLGCFQFIAELKNLVTIQDNFIYLRDKIKAEQNLS